MNNNKAFVGERLFLHLLDHTYYAHILPPLPKKTEASRLAEVEEDLRDLLAKCGAALKDAAPQLKQLLDGFGSKAA